MAKLLYLVHRLPFPPNKGDKVRSYHLLKHLAAKHEVFLGTFIDDPDDEQHLKSVAQLCCDVHAVRLDPLAAKFRSLSGLVTGKPLTVAYYSDQGLEQWVSALASRHPFDATVVFSSAMAQFVPMQGSGPVLVDFVDVDAAKWAVYARERSWPLSWIYRRESEQLLAFDRAVALRSSRSFWTTQKESALFLDLAPECSSVVDHFGNGVDTEFFQPDAARSNPFAADELPLVFTGAMDYWPNVDAVTWFAHEVLPVLRRDRPNLRLHIVGRSPTKAVLALAGDAVAVTGTVPDVRPYLQHAAVVVAPLRLARGVQNKVLEAMSMARPVVAATTCAEALGVSPTDGVLQASESAQFVNGINRLLSEPGYAEGLGVAARNCVLKLFGWEAQLRRLDPHLPGA